MDSLTNVVEKVVIFYNVMSYFERNNMTAENSVAQRAFDEWFISSSEIMKTLNVSRTTILSARRTGKLPGAIDIQGKIFIWDRDRIKPYLDAWKIVLDARRGTA